MLPRIILIILIGGAYQWTKKLAILLFGILILSLGIVSTDILYQDPLNGMNEDTFKKQCVEVSYKDMKVNDDLKNTSVKLEGKVEIAAHNTMVFHVGGDRDQEVIVNLPPDQDNSKYKKYEGLNAVIYGSYQGLDDYAFSGERPYVSVVAIE